MAHGRPDFTLLGDVDIVAQTLAQLNVDIVAQTLAQLNVDIVAQTLAQLNVDIIAQTLANLKVDINAQTLANLSVDIAAQTLAALGINITAQDLAELIIKIHAQDVGIYLQPEWAAKEGTDKNFTAYEANVASGFSTEVTYTVPAGKTVYINGIGFSICSYALADGDLNQIGNSRLRKGADTVTYCYLGGNGGNGLVLPKPIVFNAGEEVSYYVINRTNHACNLSVSCWGYEV